MNRVTCISYSNYAFNYKSMFTKTVLQNFVFFKTTICILSLFPSILICKSNKYLCLLNIIKSKLVKALEMYCKS